MGVADISRPPDVESASIPHDSVWTAIRPGAPYWRDARLRRLLAVADALAVVLASIPILIFGGGVAVVLWSLLCIPLGIVLAKLQGLYDRDQRALRHLTIDEFPQLVTWALGVTVGVSILLAVVGAESLSFRHAVVFGTLAAASVFTLRVLARWVWRRSTPAERTAIIGTGRSVTEVRRKLQLFGDIHVEIAVEQESLELDEARERPDWPASLDRMIVVSSCIDESRFTELLQLCRGARVKLSVVPSVHGMFGAAVELTHVADLPVIAYNTWDVSRSTLLLKRVTDVAVCIMLLPIILPLVALIALAVRLDSRGPVFFAQTRAGIDGRPFRMFKFRSMVPDAPAQLEGLVKLDELPEPAFKLTDDPRVTRVGQVLRRWSLDELPQFYNVLRGDMSLVGPRPEQIEVVARYRPEHRFRLKVKPGLTGPMQVFGRGALSFEERVSVEREYVENVSLRRDFRLLALTGAAVLAGRGAL